MELQIDEIASPIGEISIAMSDRGLCALDFEDCGDRMHALLTARHGAVTLTRARDRDVVMRLEAYFDGDLTALDDIPVDSGGTVFQRQVWSALRGIRPGTTLSYGELARRLGRPGAARAVGVTNSRNPVALVCPCHRVIGADGSLTGYAGGLERKRWLLAHEGVNWAATRTRSDAPRALPERDPGSPA